MIGVVLALALLGAPSSSSTVAVSAVELAQLRAQAADGGRARAALAVCHDDAADLEAVHTADLAAIRTLTSTASTSSPVLEGCALGGLLLGAAGGACAGVTDDTARTACTVVGVVTAAAGAACSIARLLSHP